MSTPHDPRPGRRFSLEEPAPSSTPRDPRPPEAYAHDLPSQALTPSHAPAEPVLEASLGRPRKRRWGLLVLLGGTLGLGAVEAGTTLYAAGIGGEWLASAWSLLLLIALTLGASALGRELWRLRRLRRHDRLRMRLGGLATATRGEADATADALRRALSLDTDHPHWQAFLTARQPHHGATELHTLLDHHLLAPRDRAARRLVSRMSGETAVMVAVSPLTLVDMSLVAWRSLAMVDRLCRLYGLELGYAARLRLLREVLRQMAFAGATEMAGEAGMEMLSMNLAGRLSTRAAQGLGIGLTSARLGLRTQRLTRPLPFDEEQAPRLADLRRELWQQLRRLEAEGERGGPDAGQA
ncbi:MULTISPECIES: YcjF family protein [unclassified Halomonas]|uniref:YcjF family protein n=1 Tax=unclassified Halomonas TaxID=2609666 RepID=UPI002888B911|nr:MULTISPECIES: YcjF family protein [unclassified Halomonas]MDT0501950.1 YcjF family protein [Halomonas sp. PAR7]MDT0510961.1 YcjF family protein [Halomonas sp. LES1]MDT0592715.1 YcjF family protein [Halomonas sp. PAR8]